MKKSKLKLCTIVILMLLCQSCKKWIEVDPPADSISVETVFTNVSTSAAVLNNIYSKMLLSNYGLNLGFSCDEIAPRLASAGYASYLNEFQSTVSNPEVDTFWKNGYGTFIYNSNLVIEKVTESKTLSETNRKQLIGEAKFIRALTYFYLVNLYGDVPLVLTTDYITNSNIQRTSVKNIYLQIVNDLIEAKEELSPTFLGPELATSVQERLRPTKWAATALLARVYLYLEKWDLAENAASEVIDNTALFSIEPVDNVFKKYSRETIWALQPNLQQNADASNNTPDGQFYVPTPGVLPSLIINDALLSKFLDTDLRKSSWIGREADQSVNPVKLYAYPNKYKIGSNTTGMFQDQQEFLVVMRISEQYLIRAEARAHLSRITGANSAAEDLNVIRHRAALSDTDAKTLEEMVKAILAERQLELFSEWGNRWLDLKRTGILNDVMSIETPKKGGLWASYKVLLPIPLSEFLNNPALRGHQNPGYREN